MPFDESSLERATSPFIGELPHFSGKLRPRKVLVLAQIFVRHRIYQRRIADMSSQLGSVAGANPRKNIGYVALDGLSGEEQPGCDLWIAVAGGNKYRDLPFAVGQLIQRGITARRTTTPPRVDAEPAQPGFRQPLLGFRTSRARFPPRLLSDATVSSSAMPVAGS